MSGCFTGHTLSRPNKLRKSYREDSRKGGGGVVVVWGGGKVSERGRAGVTVQAEEG